MSVAAPPLAVLQARTGSSRLPGKALIAFRGLPVCVLAARRAATRGLRVVLATSDGPGDDLLAATARAHAIPCVRGPLDDVLARVVAALGDVPDTTPVVRLTGDNVGPDGDLIAEALAAFARCGAGCLATGGTGTGLPYGMSVEVVRAGHLRAAHVATGTEAATSYDREHVTPWIRARHGIALLRTHAGLGLEDRRVTLDTMADLQALHRAYPNGGDPVAVPWQEIARRAQSPARPAAAAPPDLVLGTAQLGLAYGIAGAPRPDADGAADLLRAAQAAGLRALDTARAYGTSERRIGRGLRQLGWDDVALLTKLDPLGDWEPDDSPKGAAAAAEASLHASRAALGRDPDVLMLHRAAHLEAWDGAAWARLAALRDAGLVGRLGVSVQSPSELAHALRYPGVAHVQMPFNLLDHRWAQALDGLRAARADRDVTVHLRSVLLQGLVGRPDPALWARAGLDAAAAGTVAEWLGRAAAEAGAASAVDLAFRWARGLDWADGIVVGTETAAQLEDTLRLLEAPPLDDADRVALAAIRPVLPAPVLNPATWRAG